VERLGWPADMVADQQMNCIYVSDRYGEQTAPEEHPGIFAVTESGNSSHHALDVSPAGLSLTPERLLLVVCEHQKKGRSLRFFHRRREGDGSGVMNLDELVERRITLRMDRYLLQAVALGNDRFAVSHKSRGVHRIVVVDSSGTEVS